jgi:hypothetical protein
MRSLQNQILGFLEDQASPYLNRRGVEIDMSSGEVLMACCEVPGFVKNEKYQLEYLLDYESINSFIHKFSIHCLEDLDLIDAKQIDQLFKMGQVELWCHIYPSEDYLVFKKKGENFLVIHDELIHILGTPLKEFEDFHKYTRYYFSA